MFWSFTECQKDFDMPRRMLVFILLLLSAFSAQGQTANAVVESGWTNVNLRSEPNRNGVVVVELVGETQLIVTARTDDYIWYQAQTLAGQSGWLASRYVQLFVPLNSIPVYQAAATTNPAPETAPITVTGESNGRVSAVILNLRNAPSASAAVIAELPQRSSLLIVGRSADNAWIYVQTPDGLSGWVSAAYVQTTVALSSLSIIGVEQSTSTTTSSSPTSTTVANPIPTGQASFFTLGQAAANIFATGQALGNRANVFSKVGDSMSVEDEMFRPFGYGVYDLGGYGYLQTTIDFFLAGQARTDNPFNNVSLAANGGWTTATLLDTNFANSSVCNAGETPLACEYRLNKPAVALILVGSNDLVNVPVDQYAYNLRVIANVSIEAGVIPVFSTLPPRPQYPGRAEEYNQRIIHVAQELGLPLWDFYSVMLTLPNSGLSDDGLHPSTPPSRFEDAANFTGDFLQYGYVMRNLTMLQVLDVLRGSVLQ
jgi:uncharacterized protein YgiM (DUF1202 family)